MSTKTSLSPASTNVILGTPIINWTSSSASFTQIPGTVVITTVGRPVLLSFQPVLNAGQNSNLGVSGNACVIALYRDATLISSSQFGCTNTVNYYPSSYVQHLDYAVTAGVHTYTAYVACDPSGLFFQISNAAFMAAEIR